MQANQFALELIESCCRTPRLDTVVAQVKRCADAFGFQHFILTGLPWPHERFEQLVLLNGWPPDWYDRFTGRGYFDRDGVGQWALRTTEPFTYPEVPEPLRLPLSSRKIRTEARAFGLADGLVIPVRSARWRQSALSFSRDGRCDLGSAERAALHLFAVYAIGIVRNALGGACEPPPARLTVREREVLAWAAQGKSAWETSAILAISERTVIKHLEHARAKLNAATTTQAVAEGLRTGELAL